MSFFNRWLSNGFPCLLVLVQLLASEIGGSPTVREVRGCYVAVKEEAAVSGTSFVISLSSKWAASSLRCAWLTLTGRGC